MTRLLFLLGFYTVALTMTSLQAATPTTIPRTRPAPPRPSPDGQRFLFVVDISDGMRANEAANRQALFDLIFTGFDGQMRTGDSFGLWLFSDSVRSQEFPMQVWEESKSIDTASLATKFLREQKYSGRSRPDILTPRLLKVIKNVHDVTVVILSNGEAALKDTPFDAKIAAVYHRRKDERSKEGKPFVTVLVAKGGAIVTGAVVIAGEFVELPERPSPTLAGKGTNNIVAPTNNAREGAVALTPVPPGQTIAPLAVGAPQTTISLSPPPPTPNPAGSKNIRIVTRSNSPPRTVVAVPAAPANTDPAISAPPAPQAALTPPAAAPIESANSTRTEPPPVTPPPAPVATNTAVTSKPTAPPAFESAQPETLFRPPTMKVAARESAPSIPEDAVPIARPALPVQVAEVAPLPPSGLTGPVLLAIGGVLVAGCVVLFALVLRRPKFPPQVSIITRSMDRS